MASPNSTLGKLEKLAKADKLGFLGRQIKFNAFAYATMSHGTMTQEQVMEDLRQRVIYVEFGRYGSSIEKQAIREHETGEKPRNFTPYMGIEGTGVFHGPAHFHWNGSWEGLDHEMQSDVEILKALGFKIDYQGHNPKRDILF